MAERKTSTAAVKKPVKRDAAASRERILVAATEEFAEKGYDGARVDEIARKSQLNKNTLYHYFGSKDQLFTAVLERAYATIRTRQNDLSIRGMTPQEGMRLLVEFTAQIWVETPEFNKLLFSENLHEARHIKESDIIPKMYNPLMETMQDLLEKGERDGVFRSGVDPVDLYISISALSSHYISHQYTFEAIFKQALMEETRLRQRIDHAVDMVLRYLKP